jgi:hypothetical protein
MTKTIRVTKECIEQGCPENVYSCPVALALQKAMPRRKWLVGRGTLDDRARIGTPDKVLAFINRFDSGKPVKPFTFRLRLP